MLERENGFSRLEAEMADDYEADLKGQAQDLGLWAEYVNPHGMKVRLKFTIPPEREIQLNYRGLCPNDKGLHFLTFSLTQAASRLGTGTQGARVCAPG